MSRALRRQQAGWRWLAVLLIAIPLIAACSGGNDDDDGDGSSALLTPTSESTPEPEIQTGSTPTAGSEPTDTGSNATVTTDATGAATLQPTIATSPTAESSATEAMSEADTALARQLLQVEDLPEGWSAAPQLIPPPPAIDEPGVCGNPNLRNAADWEAEAEMAFASAGGRQFILERLATLSEDEAVAFMEQARQSIDCEEFADVSGNDFTIAPLELPAFGEDSFSFQMSGGGADYHFVYVRIGGTVLLLSQAAPQGGAGADLTVSLLEAAVARVLAES